MNIIIQSYIYDDNVKLVNIKIDPDLKFKCIQKQIFEIFGIEIDEQLITILKNDSIVK